MDARILVAPSSTKNRERARDPEMHQTKKGKQWNFGMKAHLGVDAEAGLTHTVVTAPANQHDVTQAPQLLHGCDPSRQVVNRKRGTSPADVSLSLSRGTYRTIPLQRETGEIRQDSTLETSLDAASAPR